MGPTLCYFEESSCACMLSFTGVAPFLFLAKVPFWLFFFFFFFFFFFEYRNVAIYTY